MLWKSSSAVLVTGLLVVGVTTSPVARPVYPGIEYAARSLETNDGAPGNYCDVGHDGSDKRAAGCWTFTCDNLQVMVLDKIGQGGSGTVYNGMAMDGDRRLDVAVKTCDAHSKCLHGAETQKTLSKVSANIGHVYAYCTRGDTVFSIQERLEGGDLFDAIKYDHRYEDDEDALQTDFSQILRAVGYMQHADWAHRDLKPQNIMFDGNDQIKIIDFDLATQASQSTLASGTTRYLAPGKADTFRQVEDMLITKVEVLMQKEYDPKRVDIWALGVTLFEMATRQSPWNSATASKTALDMVAAKNPTEAAKVLEDDWPILTETFCLLLAKIFTEADDRISIEDLKVEIQGIDQFTAKIVHQWPEDDPPQDLERQAAFDNGDYRPKN